jgi:hypothetical protein
MTDKTEVSVVRQFINAMRIGDTYVHSPAKRMSLVERRDIADLIRETCKRGFRDPTAISNAVWAMEETGLLRNGDLAEIERLRTAALLWRLTAIALCTPFALVVFCRLCARVYSLIAD